MKVCKSVRGAVKFDRLAPIQKLGARTIVWVDDIAVTKGECKHAVTDGSLAEDRITEMGTVIYRKTSRSNIDGRDHTFWRNRGRLSKSRNSLWCCL